MRRHLPHTDKVDKLLARKYFSSHWDPDDDAPRHSLSVSVSNIEANRG
jgi:hypothetical protein